MSVIQRLLSNTFLAFASNLIMKMSSTFLFIFVGRLLGTEAAGTYNLGITYFTVIFGLSAWGLQELLVREVAPRPAESGRYLINYVVMRLFLAGLFYGLLWGGLRWVLPYSADTERVILVLALAIFPEAVFGLLHSLFVAHERMGVPAVAAVVNSLFKLGGGGALLWWGGDLERVAWAVPVGSLLSLVVFVVALPWLWRAVPQAVPARLSWSFSREQLRFTKGFVVIHLFTILDFQADTFLLSLYLNEVAIGWYGAAQTVMLGFWMMPIAIRTALYPVMSRYYLEDRGRLQQLHQKAETYLPMLILPMAAGVALLAEPIILLIFDESFVVGTPALQCMIWAVVLAVMNVPNARLMLVHNKQVVAGWVTGGSMVLNIGLNIWLIPRYGIVGASLARVLATGFLFACLRWYVQRYIWRTSLVQILARPLLAVTVMGLAVWPWREALLVWPVLVGVVVYGGMAWLLGMVPAEDIAFWRGVLQRRK